MGICRPIGFSAPSGRNIFLHLAFSDLFIPLLEKWVPLVKFGFHLKKVWPSVLYISLLQKHYRFVHKYESHSNSQSSGNDGDIIVKHRWIDSGLADDGWRRT